MTLVSMFKSYLNYDSYKRTEFWHICRHPRGLITHLRMSLPSEVWGCQWTGQPLDSCGSACDTKLNINWTKYSVLVSGPSHLSQCCHYAASGRTKNINMIFFNWPRKGPYRYGFKNNTFVFVLLLFLEFLNSLFLLLVLESILVST